MTIVLVSGFLNHHLIPFCDTMVELCDEFHFISTENGASQGYQVSCDRPYMLDYAIEKTRCEQLVLKADAVIFGSCSNQLIELRMRENKLSFLYSERFFKKGTWRRFIPRVRNAIKERIVKYKNKNIFVLCASAYLSYDLALLGFPSEKCFKWGYFPETNTIDTEDIYHKEKNTILWAGRMLDLKHPEVAVETAKSLAVEGQDFTMNIVGDGPEKVRIQKLIDRYDLGDKVHLIGSLTHDELLLQMKRHEIFMFTSDFREGWGAVLNEALANGCAVVANRAIGSVPFLLEDQKNGLAYRNGDVSAAKDAVNFLLNNNDQCIAYGKAAIETMNNYNYKTAANRLYAFINEFLENSKILNFDSGILSYSKVLKG